MALDSRREWHVGRFRIIEVAHREDLPSAKAAAKNSWTLRNVHELFGPIDQD